jgi:hypothetical protein
MDDFTEDEVSNALVKEEVRYGYDAVKEYGACQFAVVIGKKRGGR